MLSLIKSARKSLILVGMRVGMPLRMRAGLGIVAIALAACQPIPLGGGAGPGAATGGPVQVALLLPNGSGSAGDEVLARSLQNAAKLAISDLGSVQIDLRVYSTGGKPAGAQAAAIRAVDEGAKIILGPVFAQNANAAGVAVASRGISVLSFSNNTDIAGGNVFVLGPTFVNTANRLASFAVSQGKRRVMVVNDRTPAGEIGRAAIERGVGNAGGSVVARVGYEFSQNGILQAAPEIAGQVRSTGADAVFMTADTAGALPLLTQMLRDNRIDPSVAQFIGLTRWDIPAATIALPGTQGGWFALPDPSLYQQYQSRYQAAYGEPPHPIPS
jgi:ABC-type branched-subunit amino acid transport system substrate-binding protein